MSERAKPMVDVTVAGDSGQPRRVLQSRRPDLAQMAAQTENARRLISHIGLALPVLFILSTIALASALGQPLRGHVDLGDLGLWAAWTGLQLTPFLAALTVMINARRGGLVWTTALVYSGLSGILGFCVGVAVLRSDASTASLDLISALIVQVVVLAPVCAAVAFLVRIVRDSTRR